MRAAVTTFGALLGEPSCLLTGAPPGISRLPYIVRKYKGPRNDDGEYHGHQAGHDGLHGVRVQLIGRPEREREGDEPYRLPEQLEEKHGQHLQRIAMF